MPRLTFIMQSSLSACFAGMPNHTDKAYIMQAGDDEGSLRHMFQSVYAISKNRGVFGDMFDSDEEFKVESRLSIASLVYAVLLRCRRLGLAKSVGTVSAPRKNSMVVDAVSYIHLHYREKLLLSDIANTLFCNSQQLSEQFRELMGISVSDYITSLRTMEVYRLLIMHPELTLAGQSGFQSMRSMLRAFRERYGCTPSASKRSGHSNPDKI